MQQQWRMGGSVNPGLRVGHHNRNASVGAINEGGKSGERGRHFPNTSMPGNMFRTPAGVVVNPMFGYGGKNANKTQSYQVCGVVSLRSPFSDVLQMKMLYIYSMCSNFLSSMVLECKQLTG